MNNETNLWDLVSSFFSWIGKLIRSLFIFLGACVRLTYRKWWIVLIMVALVMAAALYYSRPLNRIYKVNAVAVLNGPTVDMAREAWGQLENACHPGLCYEQSYQALLGLNNDITLNLRQFHSYQVVDLLRDSIPDFIDYSNSYANEDTMNAVMPDRVALSFRTKTPMAIRVIEDSLMSYLNHLPNFVAAYDLHKADIERQSKFYHDQIEKLDSLTTTFYFEEGFAHQVQFDRWETNMLIGKREVELFVDDIVDMIQKGKKADHELAMCTAPVVLVNHFTLCPRPTNGRIKCCLLALLIGWVLGLMLAYPFEKRKELLEWLKS